MSCVLVVVSTIMIGSVSCTVCLNGWNPGCRNLVLHLCMCWIGTAMEEACVVVPTGLIYEHVLDLIRGRCNLVTRSCV